MEEDLVSTELSTEIHVEWKIKKFADISEDINYNLISPDFSLSSAKWSIVIFPNGTSDIGANGWIALYLLRKHLTAECTIDFKMGIKSIDGSEFKSFQKMGIFDDCEIIFGDNKFFERSQVLSSENTLTADGTLTVFCTARILSSKTVGCRTCSAYGISSLIDNFKNLFLNREHADITIKVKDKEYFVHKCILAARSEVFALMFKHDMAEKSSSTVEVVDCDPDSFEAFINFLYTASMDVVTPSNAVSLYKIAHKYRLEDLKVECVKCIELNLSIDSICDVLQLAHLYDESDLMVSSTSFFVRNAVSILKTTKWRTLMDENGDLAKELNIKALEIKSDESSDEDSEEDNSVSNGC